ncbi:MAG TPA: hypothetical protein DEP35_01435 [Deltaproteobacteria bacterium]|nr:hypothetical protein [Deltaproteobacteria bacterium]
MLSGFNTNIRHRGVLFHVQTEDSGRAHPHIITHLFHGGNILSSEKRGYEDLLSAKDLPDEVRNLMEAQHKSMLQRLRRGEFDGLIRERLGAAAFADSSDTGATTQPEGPAVRAAPREGARVGDPLARVFGEGIVSQKPLDEVVLDYLVESARKRKRPAR